MPLMATSAATLRRLWHVDPPLTACGLLMLGCLALALAGVWLDPTTITGAPAWLKPAKFAASIAIYSLSLAWVFTYLLEWRRTRRIVGSLTAGVLLLEFVIISGQAWRGTTSHFNVATPLDAVLFSVMGVAIVVQTAATIAVASAVWRQAFEDQALGWAVRLGMTITIIGAFSGGLMTRPTGDQMKAIAAGEQVRIVGAHTVGSDDGGPGLLATGWSLEHGDLRVAHFVGLHALQALPLLALALRRRALPNASQARVMIAAGGAYAALFALLLWQALRGQSVLRPDVTTMVVAALWIAGAVAAVWVALRPSQGRAAATIV